MKRMYVTVIIIFLILFWAISGLTQKSNQDSQVFDRAKRRMELREQAHRRMMDKLLKGIGPGQGMFEDLEKMLDDTMQDSFPGFDSFSSTHFKSDWSENKFGRVLTVVPEEGQQLDIDVTNESITIKGKVEKKSEYGTSISNISNSFPVPDDCDGARVKMTQEKGKILIELPFKSGKAISVQPKNQDDLPKIPNGRVPLQPSPGDIEI